MSKDDNDVPQTVNNQFAWILNYQPNIKEQHIHLGNKEEKREGIKESEIITENNGKNQKNNNDPVKAFVNRVKVIMKNAEKDNGTMKENNSRKHPVQYKYNVDGKGFCEVMNDLLLTHEKELSDYLDGATIETAVSIKYVAPFVGFVLDTHLYTPEMMPKNTFTEAFKFVYGENTSAVAKMSDKNPSEEAKKLFAVTREIMEKHKQA